MNAGGKGAQRQQGENSDARRVRLGLVQQENDRMQPAAEDDGI